MHEKLHEALDEIQDRYISQAAHTRRRPKLLWLSTVAAVLAVAILISAVVKPTTVYGETISLAAEPRIARDPNRNITTAAALSQLSDFFAQGNQNFLTGSPENQLWSPINACLSLSMVAEIAGGTSRQQVLSLLGADSISSLRSQSSALWESAYINDGRSITTLANSLWLEEGLPFRPAAAEALSYHYYADVYQGDLGSSAINNAIGGWLNEKTGGLLKSAAENIQLSQETILSLYSTIYFQAKWTDQFHKDNNTQDIFHAASGDRNVTYMNRKLAQMHYYWGDTFSAIALQLKNGSTMWFFLPDEGSSPEDLLADKQYLELFSQNSYENRKYMKVNLSIPKFDISGSQNLREGLEEMGVTDIFSADSADLSPIIPDMPAFFSAANQAVRVQIDEDGVKAAAYTEFPAPGSAEPPKEIVDFVLNRPFLFMITDSNVPLFAGVVREP